jgi:hypothetical protein
VSTVVTSVVGSPLVKAAAFSYGVRRALGGRQQHDGHLGEQVATGRVVQSPRAKGAPRRTAKSGKGTTSTTSTTRTKGTKGTKSSNTGNTGDTGKIGNTGGIGKGGRSGAGRK